MENSLLFIILLIVVFALACARYLRSLVFLWMKRVSRFFPKKVEECFLNQSRQAYSLFIFYFVCQIGFSFLDIEEKWTPFLYQPLNVILAYSLLRLSWQFLDIAEVFVALHLRSKDKDAQSVSLDSITKHLLPYSKKVFKIMFATITVLLFLQNSGFNVTSLLAGLGIGGVAIALASKDTLSHFFGGLTVIVDKPFSVGDWIICNQVEGTVQDIGFRSTKVKTFYDSLMTVPNAVISDSIIDNLGKRQARRTRVTLDITYSTDAEKIEVFVQGIRDIIKSNPCSRKDYFQCYFSGYGPHSLQIFLNFFLKVRNWDEELSQKQSIFLEILKLAEKLKVSFAFPTRTLDIPKGMLKQLDSKVKHPGSI